VNIDKHIKPYLLKTYVITGTQEKSQENKTPQASTSIDPTPAPIIYNYDQANDYFQKNLISNPFGYACYMCDRLRYTNDLNQVKEKNT
jgi:hypothetical protein